MEEILSQIRMNSKITMANLAEQIGLTQKGGGLCGVWRG